MGESSSAAAFAARLVDYSLTRSRVGDLVACLASRRSCLLLAADVQRVVEVFGSRRGSRGVALGSVRRRGPRALS